MALADCRYDSVVIGPNADLTDYNIMQNFSGRSITLGEGTAFTIRLPRLEKRIRTLK